MSGQTQAFIGIVICILALATADLLTNLRVNGVRRWLKQIAEIMYMFRSESNQEVRKQALSVVEDRKKELDKQERAIHEEMGNLNHILFSTTSLLREFTHDIEDSLNPLATLWSALEDDYEYPPPRHRYPAGGGRAEGGASTQDDLPDAQRKIGGGR